MDYSRDGDQLELDLFPGEPWGGRSPRVLTKAKISLFLRREPESHGVEVDPLQLLLWPVTVKPPRGKRLWEAPAAPTLLPLPRLGLQSSRRGSYKGGDHGETTEW